MPVAKRRSVSIDKYVHDSINSFRAFILTKTDKELDYTSTLNFFAEYGIRTMYSTGTPDPVYQAVLDKYWDYDELKAHALVDEWIDFQNYREWKQKQAQKTIQQVTK